MEMVVGLTVYGGFCRLSGEELRIAEPMSPGCGSCILRSRGGGVASEEISHVLIWHSKVKSSYDNPGVSGSFMARDTLGLV